MNTYFKENGFKYVVLIIFLFLVYLYHDNIKLLLKPTPAPQVNVTVPKQEVSTKETIVKEVVVEKPSKAGEVVSFVQREGKTFVVIGDKELEVPNTTGKPTAELGKDGTLRITQEMQSKIDLTETITAQARMIANYEIEKEKARIEKERKKEKAQGTVEKILIGVGGLGIGIIAGKASK